MSQEQAKEQTIGMLVKIASLDTKTHANIRTRNGSSYPDDSPQKKKWLGFVASIKKHGVEQPITVCVNARGGWTVVDGFSRVQGATEAGLDVIPCYVVTSEDAVNRIEKALVANLQRDDLHWVDTARALASLTSDGTSARSVANAIGMSAPFVSTHVKVASHPIFEVAEKRYDAGLEVASFDATLECVRAWGENSPFDSRKDYVRICEGREESEEGEGEGEGGEEAKTGKKRKIKVTYAEVREQLRLARKEGVEETDRSIQILKWVAGDLKRPVFKAADAS